MFLVTAIGCGVLVNGEAAARVVLAAGIAIAIVMSGLPAPRRLVLVLICWLVFMALIRRIISGYIAEPADADPILLVGPAAIVALLALVPVRGMRIGRTGLMEAVLLLTSLFLLSTFNPIQGNLEVGVGGAVLIVVPMLGFWIGRSFLDDWSFRALLRLVGLLALLAALYGLFQLLVGFPSWDSAWIRNNGYRALIIEGFARPFSFFSSVNEYATFLAVGVCAWVTVGSVFRYRIVRYSVPALLVGALWLSSVRAMIVLGVVAVGVAVAAKRGMSFWRAGVIAMALLLALPFVVSQFISSGRGTTAQEAFIEHQVGGLADPFGDRSTLGTHAREVVDGLKLAIVNPSGAGVGTVTPAAQRFGGNLVTAEADIGDAAIIGGIPGVLTFLTVTCMVIARGYRVAARRQDALSVAALAIVILTFSHWLTGGQYAVCALAWLVIGWIDRAYNDEASIGGAVGSAAGSSATGGSKQISPIAK